MPNYTSKVRVAIVGAGRWGPNLIRLFHDDDRSELIGVAEVDRGRLEVLQRAYPNVSCTADWRQIVSRLDVDAVVISTPASTHFEIARMAVEKGKHVFVEKPISTSAKEGALLLKIAEKHKRKVMVGHVFLFHPGIQLLKDKIVAGELGELLYLYSQRTNLGPIRSDVNAMWDLAPHDLSIFLYLLGRAPQWVSAQGASFINPPVEDVVFGYLQFPKGILANLHVSWLDPKKVRRLVVVGSKKMAIFDDMDLKHPVRLFNKAVPDEFSNSLVSGTVEMFRKSIIEGEEECPPLPATPPLKAECDAFLEWLISDSPQMSTGLFGLQIVQILEKLEESLHQQGKTLPIDQRDKLDKAA